MIRTTAQDVLPPVAPVRRLAAPLTGIAETVELTVVQFGAGEHTVAAFERALDGLVRQAHRDRAALTTALSGAVGEQFPRTEEARRVAVWHVVPATLLGRIPGYSLRPASVLRPRGHEECAQGGLDRVLAARVREIGYALLSGRTLPFLLATPTWDTGALDAAELVERLAEYQRSGVRPGAADFGQALLRVRRDGPDAPAAAAAAARLGTAEGGRLAAWLGPDGAPGTPLRRTGGPCPRAHRSWARPGAAVPQVVFGSGARPALLRDFPDAFHWLGRPHEGFTQCYHWHGGHPVRASVLPEDREAQAAWLLPSVTLAATVGAHGDAWMLPHLARLGGPAGPALHAAVAAGLGAQHPEQRRPAVQALLVLAARGELHAGLLGRELAAMAVLGTVKPNRLADATRSAAGAGAYATVWAVLAEALPGLLPSVRTAGELLAVAADCAERCGARGPVPPEVAAVAARRGSHRPAAEARRLAAALTAS
ncbi:DUF7824 domain-containing protein [Streptomyces sp. NPDC004244]|uniref:DUF7824 domain-containing protein n=1 Tax=Streptomyces sp. NPDC101206 TaxID=3366128 RepID=UPI0037F1FEB9